MKRPLGCACLLFILFIRLFYVCFPPSLPDYGQMDGREVYINGQIISIKVQELYDGVQTVYTLSKVTVKESSAVSGDSYLSDKSISAEITQEEKLNMDGDSFYSNDRIYCYTAQEYPDVSIGSWVWVKGTFEPYEAAENPGQFDSRFYYYMQGVGARVKDTELVWSNGGCNILQENLQRCKNFFLQKLDANFSEKYGGVMKTILLGDRSDLDKDLKNLFQEGGILHILTISGMHISMLGMGSFRLLRKAGASQKVSAVAGIGIILLYGAMIGTQAATFRAICMFALQMAAILTGRTYDRLTGLSVAAVLLLLERPLYVFYSGFLLSFGAVLGVTVVSPLLEKLCKNKSAWVKWFCKLFSGGIGILLATFPVQLYFYYEYSIYSMLVNVLVLPLLPYIVGLGLAVLAIPQVTAVLTVPVVLGCEGLLRIFEWVCIQSQKLPFHSLVLGAPKGWQIVCYYGCLAICVGCLNRIAAGNTGKLNAIEYFKKYKLPGILSFGTFLASVIILLWRPVEGLTCRFLSVGQGDCAVMQYGSETYVVDCGSTSSSNVGTQILLPCLKYYGVSEVDGVFISHADADHMNGIVQWLEEYEHSHVQIGSIILPSLTKEALSEEFGELIEAAGLWNIPVVSLGAGDELDMGELTINVLHPAQNCSETEDANGYSQVLLFTYKEQGILMTGDIGAEQEFTLCEEMKQPVTVLKAPHHGSKYSSSAEFLTVCRPDNIILSYGVGNSYGHPHKEAIKRMQEVSSTLWYTGRSGTIECVVTGKGVRIQGFR